ncbi:hypothetical protein ISCGN_001106 [Ixodes scapularis]
MRDLGRRARLPKSRTVWALEKATRARPRAPRNASKYAGPRVRPVRGAVGRRASPAPACVLTARKHVGGRSAARPARPTVVGIIRTKTSGGGRPARTPVRGEARRSSPQGCRASGRASNQHANAAAGLSSRAAAAGSLLAGRRVTPTARRPTSRPHVTVGQRHRQARRRKVARRTQFCLAPAAPANVYCSFSPPRSAYVRSTLGGPLGASAGCWPTAYARRFSESAPTYFLSPGPRAACFVARPVADTPSGAPLVHAAGPGLVVGTARLPGSQRGVENRTCLPAPTWKRQECPACMALFKHQQSFLKAGSLLRPTTTDSDKTGF